MVSTDLANAMHGNTAVAANLGLTKLYLALPDLALSSSGKKYIDLIERKLAVHQNGILLLRPVTGLLGVVLEHEARSVRSGGGKRSWLIETG
jgi:hypothetical protein